MIHSSVTMLLSIPYTQTRIDKEPLFYIIHHSANVQMHYTITDI